MVVQLENGKIYNIFSIKDVKELIDPELFEAIVELTNNKSDTLQDEVNNLETELNSYDSSCYGMRSAISEVTEYIEKLVKYIEEAKKLDRNKIIEGLNSISVNLEDCEGY